MNENAAPDSAKDYRSTVFLPDTAFPMRGDLPKREPVLLERWAKLGLWQKMRAASKGREKYVLHDGPPYANGNLHIGHALNKILKDIINRAQQMSGKDSVYVPGWDCHGLPIEWKIEEEYRAKKKSKDDVPIVEFRKECRDFARHWIGVQKAEFERLGVTGDWEHPYTTMEFPAEAQIVREIGKFLMNGSLYRGSKPVMWSVVEQTALAEAEIEYHDHVSTQVWVKFPVAKPGNREIANSSILIWTTTPWTLPGNRAIAYGADMNYLVLLVSHAGPNSLAKPGERLVVAESRWAALEKDLDFKADMVMVLKGEQLAGTICRHPLHGVPEAKGGYDFDVPLLAGDFVTEEDGTGFVHMAPGHGADDFDLCTRNHIKVPETVAGDGTYYPTVPLFAGKRVYKPNGKEGDANQAVIAAIQEAGGLLGEAKLTHSYPHSWRSKAPLIFRTTPQWFISMETNGLRATALKAIEDTRWIPAQGKNRIRSMIETRPDWCISRQRAWGVPIAVFVDKKTGEVLRDQGVIDRIAASFEKEGSDAWFAHDPGEFLGPSRKASDYEQVKDIVDVWFDSGSTHAFVLEARKDLKWPASLYLEGSDQHRGWFHSSLLESCGTRGRAPYEAVLTHGFVLDEQGRKMSKSLGNVTSPQEVVGKSGADILRLWVVAADYAEDLRIGPEILKQQSEFYRRLRNTLRYLLGALKDFSPREKVEPKDMPELERWVLHRLWQLGGVVRSSVEAYDFHTMFTELHNFCAVDLSAFYFDVRKDSLYCDPAGDVKRRAARATLDLVFDCLVKWLAPVLCFTAEEAWLCRHGDAGDASVHLQLYPEIPASWRDDAIGEKWEKIRTLRRAVTGAIELKRAEKFIGSSLQATIGVYAESQNAAGFKDVNLPETFITSDAVFMHGDAPAGAFTLPDVPGIAVVVDRAAGEKCARCWKVLPEVGSVKAHPDLCHRCADAVDGLAKGGV